MIMAKATPVDLLPIACRANSLPVDVVVATVPRLPIDEGAGGTYELVGSKCEAVLLEVRDRPLVGPIWAVPPHTLFE